MAFLSMVIRLFIVSQTFVQNCTCGIEFGPFGIVFVNDTTQSVQISPFSTPLSTHIPTISSLLTTKPTRQGHINFYNKIPNEPSKHRENVEFPWPLSDTVHNLSSATPMTKSATMLEVTISIGFM